MDDGEDTPRDGGTELVPLGRGEIELYHGDGKLPALTRAINKPYKQLLPTLRLARDLDIHRGCGSVEQWRDQLADYLLLDDARRQLSKVLLPDGSRNDDAMRRRLIRTLVKSVYHLVGAKPAESAALIDGVLLLLFDGDELAEALGKKDRINATPETVAMAALGILGDAKFTPKPSEFVAAVRKARDVVKNRWMKVESCIDGLRHFDLQMLETNREAWRAMHAQNPERGVLMLNEHDNYINYGFGKCYRHMQRGEQIQKLIDEETEHLARIEYGDDYWDKN
jgi:hypothetical protein